MAAASPPPEAEGGAAAAAAATDAEESAAPMAVAPVAAAGTFAEPVAPNQTIYINNLNERVRKEVLKKELYALFSQFGPILDIVCAPKLFHLRGQAWIVFKDVPSATNAIRGMNMFLYRDKMMHITYAKEKSDPIAELEGKEVDKEGRRARKRRRVEEHFDQIRERKKRVLMAGTAVALDAYGNVSAAASGPAAVMEEEPSSEPPNKILFVVDLPSGANMTTMETLFSKFAGYVESRMVPGKGIAFIEFENEIQAALALQTMNGYALSDEFKLHISFAKK